MPGTARTQVKGNACDCEMDDPGTKKKTATSSKESYDEKYRIWTADTREICRTCRLRVDAKGMGIECNDCKR